MTDTADLAWRRPAGYFRLRVAAIIVRDRHLLTASVPGCPYSFLPGGKVGFGEVTREALVRELVDGLGVQLPIGELALVSENLVAADETSHHFCFYYRVDWPEDLSLEGVNAAAEDRRRCAWSPMDRLRSLPFRPAALVDHLLDLPRSVSHGDWPGRGGRGW